MPRSAARAAAIGVAGPSGLDARVSHFGSLLARERSSAGLGFLERLPSGLSTAFRAKLVYLLLAILVSALYGALIANLVCLPLADKLALRSQQELETKNLILDAALGIARGLSGMVFTETLKIHLSPKTRLKVVPKAKKGGAAS